MLSGLEKTLPSLAPEDDEELKRAGAYEEAQQHVSDVIGLLTDLPSSLEAVDDAVQEIDAESIPDIQLALGKVRVKISETLANTRRTLHSLLAQVNNTITDLQHSMGEWTSMLEKQR